MRTRETSPRRRSSTLCPGLLWALTVFFSFRFIRTQTVTQSQTTVTRRAGQAVTMNCKYETTWSYYYLYWYKQPPSGEMVFLISQFSSDQNAIRGRYSVNFQKANTFISLTISSLQLADSAKYFCALLDRPGDRWDISWFGSKLTFGTGTRLIVEAKSQSPAKPSVFVMRNGTNVACLVKDFYPKNINISLQSSKKIIEYDPAIVVSPSGKYNAVKLGQYEDSNSVKCSVEHNNEIVSSMETEQTTKSPGDLKPTEPEIIRQTSESCHEPKVFARKVNMISLTVLGLRLLFIKAVAVNFLLTAKLFFC